MIDTASGDQDRSRLNPADWRCMQSRGYSGWTLDAFDFFVVVFMVDVLAKQFVVGKVRLF